MIWPATRHEAQAQGISRFSTGVPCRNGHLSERRTDDGKCVACINERARARFARDPDHVRKLAAEYKAKNYEKVLSQKRESYHRHKDSIRKRINEKYATDAATRERVARARALWTAKNYDRKREADRQWYRENTARHRAFTKAWKQANAERIRELCRLRYARDPERIAANNRRWRENNPEYTAKSNAARRARKLNAEGTYSPQDVKRIFAAQKGRCACCGQKKKLTVDHIVPLTKGGTNWPRNLQGLCLNCNSQKNARDPIEFMRDKGALL